jgi:hypothetical protein
VCLCQTGRFPSNLQFFTSFVSYGSCVINRHSGLVGDVALDVVDADVMTEDRPRIRVRLLDVRAGKADERRIQQGIAQVAGEAEEG